MATRHDLVIAARSGDADAFMGLVRTETPEAYRLTLAILRDPCDAEDALQDAFARSWQRLPELRDPERWAAWFRRIVVTAALDAGRRKRSSRMVPLGLHEPPPLSDSSEAVATRDEVSRAIRHLDVSDRALLALRFGHDLELPDVAVALGIPLGTAKSRLHRVLARLRAQLESVDGYRGSPSGATGTRVGATGTEPGL